jgi:MFS family permease
VNLSLLTLCNTCWPAMTTTHPQGRRASSTQLRHEDYDGTTSLRLIRTRSLEDISVAESVAVHEIASQDSERDTSTTPWPRSVTYLLLLCGFLMSLSFGVTQVPLLYVFRLMTCDAYYKNHPPGAVHGAAPDPVFSTSQWQWQPQILGESDRCSIRPIESSTALSVSLLGASTTIFGTGNLFLTGALIKRIGVKPTLMTQILFPALRLLVQNIGVEVWGNTGMIIVQCSQIVSFAGGPSGYLLALNTFITEVVDYEGRTAALGRLSGSMFFGSATGFLLGGIAAESFGIKAPFRLTFLLFMIVGVYAFLCLPHIPPAAKKPDSVDSPTTKTKSAVTKFFGPLTVFAPRKFISKDGVVKTEYGAFLLAWGVYLGILATGYLVTLLQLFATDIFDFGTKQNGALIFMYSMLRGVFLTFAFPKLIAVGRKMTSSHKKQRSSNPENATPTEREPLLSTAPNGAPAPHSEETGKRKPPKEETFAFDLTYTQFSLIVDGFLTLLCTFVHKGWQMYLIAAILPFGAGTGSAAKGTVLQMVGSSATSAERTDALAGVSLVENIARLSTVSIFGMVFAAFAIIGRQELVFTCNAAVALVGFCVLIFARFPPEGSRRLDLKDEQTQPS